MARKSAATFQTFPKGSNTPPAQSHESNFRKCRLIFLESGFGRVHSIMGFSVKQSWEDISKGGMCCSYSINTPMAKKSFEFSPEMKQFFVLPRQTLAKLERMYPLFLSSSGGTLLYENETKNVGSQLRIRCGALHFVIR